MLKISEYVEYLLHTPFNYTCTNLAAHKTGVSHDVISDFLRTERLTPAQLFEVVRPHINDSEDAVIIADDSVQDKRYSKMIELVKNQYSGNVGGLVRGINLLNFVHSDGLNHETTIFGPLTTVFITLIATEKQKMTTSGSCLPGSRPTKT